MATEKGEVYYGDLDVAAAALRQQMLIRRLADGDLTDEEFMSKFERATSLETVRERRTIDRLIDLDGVEPEI